MSDDSHSTGHNEWMDMQRKYWQAWTALGRQTLGAGPTEKPGNPWADALDQWWQAVAPAAPSEVEEFYARLVEQGKAFFRLSEGLSESFRRTAPAGGAADQWSGEIEKGLAGLKDALTGSGADSQNVLRQVMAFWELPLDTWQRTVSSMSVLPGDFLQSLRTEELERVTPVVEGGIDRFLSIPGVGYTREWQEQLQAQWRLWFDYCKADQEYLAGYAKIGTRSVERLEQRLKQLLKEDKQITTLRELYDLWVDCCEDVYGDYVATDEYAELHARLVNGLMKLKHHGSAMVDELLAAMNMPTQREIATLQRRLQEMRRDGKALRAELQSLKDQVESLARARHTSGPSTAQTSKSATVAKRTAASKQPARRTSRRKKETSAPVAGRTSARDAVKGG
jgi:class III poly(R)-hydroxyalkanoic acid synthase PhaE subunit